MTVIKSIAGDTELTMQAGLDDGENIARAVNEKWLFDEFFMIQKVLLLRGYTEFFSSLDISDKENRTFIFRYIVN